ncbi:low molecular weight phosphotyrosine protein phosphatase [Flavobacterium sp. MXW15]|uniref:protein-tyrosine-phosphatase n=1 Tax=Xanthomonas chitinilytica TaxID=2989819 RepID=A0ABT3K006_9XANT|nr:low molecular weight protein-tyrosine-phosphatase [Xanthomonas sp. H13-6]MCW4456362.1 low molecular weight phosphotyrosine protein phosphatase [Flavobacterium sp. MXW15]MCW4474068.1 low molecular weight phosphotyrosine protein phosphatase [Xanthomonas sp. H13-6]
MKLLVVCLGNICRSPMAEGALRARIAGSPLAGRVEVDSAGTGDWHVGQPPDRRAIACARGHGVDISGLRGRQLQPADFERFDWILCADGNNLRDAARLAPAAGRQRLALWLPWAGIDGDDAIPDPYTGGPQHFEQAWALVDAAASATVRRLVRDADSGIIAP